MCNFFRSASASGLAVAQARSCASCHKTTSSHDRISPPPLRSRQFAYLHRPTRLEVRIAGHEGFGIVSRGGSDANISNQVPGDVRRGGTLAHADPATDLAASFEYAFLSESFQIRVPGTRIIGRRIVVHEQNVIGHRYHLRRAIQTTRPRWAGIIDRVLAFRIVVYSYCVIARESGQSSNPKRLSGVPFVLYRSTAEYWILRLRGR